MPKERGLPWPEGHFRQVWKWLLHCLGPGDSLEGLLVDPDWESWLWDLLCHYPLGSCPSLQDAKKTEPHSSLGLF